MTVPVQERRSAPAPVLVEAEPSKLAARLRTVRNPLLGVVGLLVLWQVVTATGIVQFFVLPQPVEVVQAFGQYGPQLVRHGLATLTVAFTGFVIGTVAACACALAFTYSRPLRSGFYPLLLAMRAMPLIAVITILVVVLGTGYSPRIVVTALGAFFTTLVNMVRGLRSADGVVEELMHTLSANGVQRLFKVRLFAAAPYLMASLRISASSCVIEATVAEWITGNVGLGYLVQVSGYTFQLPLMWAAIAVAAALTLIALALVGLLERVATPWVPHEPAVAGVQVSKLARRKARA